MSDNVIKNPARKNQPPQPQKYEPEYQRLGKEPQIKDFSPTDTFASLDSLVFDANGNEVKNPQGLVIDNNDFVNIDNNFSTAPSQPEEFVIPDIGQYILMVFGDIVVSGPLNVIEDRVKAIIYGEDKQFVDLAPEKDDIVVLRRIGIKVGIFLDE